MKKVLFAVVAAVVALLSADFASGGEVDILVNKLVEKGILTRAEADELVLEMKQETAKQKQVENAEPEIPGWVARTKISGDLRLRYQNEERDDESRERGRYRLRLGMESEVVDTVKIGLGLATGSGDPRSTNQTFTNSFEKPEVRFDYAFGKWQPVEWFEITGGKMYNPLFRPSDLLWDTDITPEGLAVRFPFTLSGEIGVFLNTCLFIIDERSAAADPYMFAVQPGLTWTFLENLTVKFAGTYYGIEDVQGASLDHSSETNTLSDGGLAFEYNSYGLSGEIAVGNIAGFLPYLGLFGEFIKNPDPDDNNEGYLGGIALGHAKIGDLWDWQLRYSYRRLEQDAWLDILPDSDFFGGATGVKGSEINFSFGLTNNILLGFNYFNTESIGDNITEELVQADIYFNF